jgi:hypothetical protein
MFKSIEGISQTVGEFAVKEYELFCKHTHLA